MTLTSNDDRHRFDRRIFGPSAYYAALFFGMILERRLLGIFWLLIITAPTGLNIKQGPI